MLIILCSNYLTIIAISLMIILSFFFSFFFSPFVVVQCFSMMQAAWLGPPLSHLSVSKEYTEGCVIISPRHSLGLPGHTQYF